ncbi:MAG: mechanosensitive ion channel family protein [Ruminococcaceae bacterium]|nr:mechanosensitive ion channel family protein [Oscillospiraceae bacterium]
MDKVLKEVFNFGTKDFSIDKLVWALIVFAICAVVIKIIVVILKKALRRGKADKSYIGYILTVVRIALYFIAIIIFCDIIGIPISSLLAVLSVAGLALSLSVQDVLSNLISGFVILITKPFGGGDFIEIAGKTGKVKAIGFMHTTLLTADNKTIYIPNHEVSVSNIINYSSENSRRVDLSIDVSYDNSAEEVKQSIEKAFTRMGNLIYLEPEAFVGVKTYGNNAVSYDIKVWCDNKDYWDVYYRLNELIRECFNEDGIVMTYDHINVHVVEDVNKK